MATEKAKRERILDRTYDDKNGTSVVTNNKTGDTAFEVALSSINSDVLAAGALRIVTSILVNAYTTALNAEGGNEEKALQAVEDTLAELQSGEYKFRAGAGEGGLTLEQEKDVIIKTVVALGIAPTEELARAKVEEFYAVTKERTVVVKGKERKVVSHPEYSKVKRIPQIRDALTKAEGDTSVKDLTSMFAAKEEQKAA